MEGVKRVTPAKQKYKDHDDAMRRANVLRILGDSYRLP